ncbi:MAG: UDP-N-acetylmuramate dehydrogenase [Betaproteobacteria bacterium]|nr:UDP-N-acetylmuramate dehydrogenase [Betaproteobacteria bacterium]
MNMAEHEKFIVPGLRGELRLREPMNRHTSWRAGGAADRAYVPVDLADLCAFLSGLPAGEPVHMVGLGSNLLVRDGGIRGTVVLLHGALKAFRIEEVEGQGGRIYSEAGVAGPKVARLAAMHDLEGAEFLAGIPGTVGGALAMNAGCYGSETWEIVEMVATVDRRGNLRERSRGDYEIGYRHVVLKGGSEEWFVAAWLRLRRGDGEASRARIREFLTRRIRTQPLNLPNAGSVFRNPRGDYAARLIETCGLKGFRVGGAQVSPLHANFIVNTGGATAADIETVIRSVQERVRRETGVLLEQEVRIIGEP